MAVSKRSSKLPYNRAIQRPSQRTARSSSVSVKPSVKKHNRWLPILTKAFFILGFVLLGVYVILRTNQEIQLAYVTPPLRHQSVASEGQAKAIPPIHITIPKVHIDLPIAQTSIHNNIWQIAQDGASHLDISARPGEPGTIIMYGHNTNDRFGPVRWLSKGDRIDIMTADRKKHSYTITKTMRVKPDKMDVFTQEGETLILYTCDGFADLERFVIVAKPI